MLWTKSYQFHQLRSWWPRLETPFPRVHHAYMQLAVFGSHVCVRYESRPRFQDKHMIGEYGGDYCAASKILAPECSSDGRDIQDPTSPAASIRQLRTTLRMIIIQVRHALHSFSWACVASGLCVGGCQDHKQRAK